MSRDPNRVPLPGAGPVPLPTSRADAAGTSTSVVRAFDILERVSESGEAGITLGALAAGIPTAKSTTHRYVATLLALGALRRDDAGRLRLGLKLVELAGLMLETDDIRSAAVSTLHELASRTGETVHLGVLADMEIVYTAKVESPHSVRLVSRIGARVPLYCSAMGKAVLARLTGTTLATALTIPRVARTHRTLVDDARLLADLERIRATGVAIDDEENEIGVRCMGAAVLGPTGDPVAGISVSAPEVRMSHERCAELAPYIAAAAEQISRRLGRSRMTTLAQTHTR